MGSHAQGLADCSNVQWFRDDAGAEAPTLGCGMALQKLQPPSALPAVPMNATSATKAAAANRFCISPSLRREVAYAIRTVFVRPENGDLKA